MWASCQSCFHLLHWRSLWRYEWRVDYKGVKVTRTFTFWFSCRYIVLNIQVGCPSKDKDRRFLNVFIRSKGENSFRIVRSWDRVSPHLCWLRTLMGNAYTLLSPYWMGLRRKFKDEVLDCAQFLRFKLGRERQLSSQTWYERLWLWGRNSCCYPNSSLIKYLDQWEIN